VEWERKICRQVADPGHEVRREVLAVRKEHGTPAPLPASAWEWERKSASRGAGGPGRAWNAGTLAGIGGTDATRLVASLSFS